MNIRAYHKQHRYLNTMVLHIMIFSLLFSACSSIGESTQEAKPQVTPTSTQPVTAQQLRANPVVYVALGASDAVGVGSQEPNTQGYVPLVANKLPEGSRLINLGISGIQLNEALNQELPLAISASPQLITIWLVANDFVAGIPYTTYMKDLQTLLQQLRKETKAHIAMANLPDLTLLPLFAKNKDAKKAQLRGEIQRWNAQINSIAKQYNVTIVDLYSKNSQLTSHPEFVSGDGFHPSPAGYAELAGYFWTAINK